MLCDLVSQQELNLKPKPAKNINNPQRIGTHKCKHYRCSSHRHRLWSHIRGSSHENRTTFPNSPSTCSSSFKLKFAKTTFRGSIVTSWLCYLLSFGVLSDECVFFLARVRVALKFYILSFDNFKRQPLLQENFDVPPYRKVGQIFPASFSRSNFT